MGDVLSSLYQPEDFNKLLFITNGKIVQKRIANASHIDGDRDPHLIAEKITIINFIASGFESYADEDMIYELTKKWSDIDVCTNRNNEFTIRAIERALGIVK